LGTERAERRIWEFVWLDVFEKIEEER